MPSTLPTSTPLTDQILRILDAVRRRLPGVRDRTPIPHGADGQDPLLFDPTEPESLGAARQRLQAMTVGEIKALYLADGAEEATRPEPRGTSDTRLAMRILIRQELRRRGLDASVVLDPLAD